MSGRSLSVVAATDGHVGSPSPQAVAVAVAAADQIVRRRANAERASATPDRNRWRFSGRSWDAPIPLRRDRPFR